MASLGFLVGAAVDDSLFSSSKGKSTLFAPPVAVAVPATQSSELKAKKDKKDKKSKSKAVEAQPEPVQEPVSSSDGKKAKKDKVKKAKAIVEPSPEPEPVVEDEEPDLEESDESDEEQDDEVEKAYAAKLAVQQKAASSKGKKRKVEEVEEEDEDDEEEEDEDEGEEGDEIEQDESESESESESEEPAPAAAGLSKKRADRVSDATEEARTFFVGNVPVSCSFQRAEKKSLLAHLVSFCTLESGKHPKIESVRFRSMSFTSKVFGRKGDAEQQASAAAEKAENHQSKRTRAWREQDDFPNMSSKSKKLTEGEKRKVAFFNRDLNEARKTCNAYCVLKPLGSEEETAAALKEIVERANGSAYADVHLRVDYAKPAAKGAAAGKTEVPLDETRRTIFLGGLDFTEQEEGIRKAIQEALGNEGRADKDTLVHNVRIIRDSVSGLGKGIAYVLLKDGDCVDELLAMEKPLRISKKKIRLERCKSTVALARQKASAAKQGDKKRAREDSKKAGGASPAKKQKTSGGGSSGKKFDFSALPKPRPAAEVATHQQGMASKLAALPKDERKKLKSVDAMRLERRALKKNAKRMELAKEKKESKGGVLGKPVKGKKKEYEDRKKAPKASGSGKSRK